MTNRSSKRDSNEGKKKSTEQTEERKWHWRNLKNNRSREENGRTSEAKNDGIG